MLQFSPVFRPVRRKGNPEMKRIFAATLLTAICSISVLAQTESRADVLKDMETKRAELAKLEKMFLSPTAEDRSAYAEFLEQPNTGLIRLLPREVYDPHVNKKSALTVRGGGAYYSFTRQSHEYGNATEIGLEQGYLQIGGFGGASYGMLGKYSGALENISTEIPGVMFLAKYDAVTDEPGARLEARRTASGITVDGMSYVRRLPVEVGATYVGRSINFDEADALFAFKVVRQDTDGSLILAWKLLQKYPVPKLARN